MKRRRIGVLMLLGALLAAWVSALPATGARGSSTPSAQHRLYIVFLPGLCGPIADPNCHGAKNAASRGLATFGALIAALRAAHVRYKSVYYSYNPATSDTYSAGDTHQAIVQSVRALQRQLQTIRRQDSGAQFDLVGHSLGGVIAANWTVNDARLRGSGTLRGVRGYLHSVVTLDSPLKGIQAQQLGALLSGIFGGAVWLDLQSGSPTIRQITSLPNAWWRLDGHLHTVANRADLIVPPSEALLGDKRQVTDSHCGRDLFFLSSCHGAVLQDASLSRFIACHWITDDRQCIVTPTPTPTLTATPTPTLTPAPTLTPTVTSNPSPTATPTIPPGSGPPSPP